jgi:hypothetical protein
VLLRAFVLQVWFNLLLYASGRKMFQRRHPLVERGGGSITTASGAMNMIWISPPYSPSSRP